MTLILVTILAFLFLLGLIMVGFLWYMKAVAGILIVRKHEELERITASNDIPEQWTARHNERIIKLHQQGNLEKSRKLQEAARRSYVRKLKRLAHYLRRTRLVDSEETRTYTLMQLDSVRMKWEEQSSHG
ncbi:hypothetical protein [Paenibacillus nasutitermitis]|uniref:Uncharacterized protein n=1 Tax=Paenibacillus nasutitermitis TaxID=1652958 RepID=A0A917E0T7_9BACL|nr:hypothetical protein [Paenibacillus nasutitermitis]GGD89181.1 hypothetical protein GCM10010911_54740 [Paenibacillus nasutitermitis]